MIVVVSLAAAYDIFLLPYSVSDIYSEYHAGERLSTSGFNWAAGMYGGQLVGEVRGYYGEIRFFSSGKMEETDENGNVIDEFYSNFIRLKAGKHFSLGRYRLILGGGFMYIGLAPRERALSPFIYFYGFRDINFKKAALEIFSLLDNLGYEALPIGLSRDVLPIRFSSGMKIKGNRFSGLAEVSYFSVGGISGKVGGDISINILKTVKRWIRP